jgi:hypothetical protein
MSLFQPFNFCAISCDGSFTHRLQKVKFFCNVNSWGVCDHPAGGGIFMKQLLEQLKIAGCLVT